MTPLLPPISECAPATAARTRRANWEAGSDGPDPHQQMPPAPMRTAIMPQPGEDRSPAQARSPLHGTMASGAGSPDGHQAKDTHERPDHGRRWNHPVHQRRGRPGRVPDTLDGADRYHRRQGGGAPRRRHADPHRRGDPGRDPGREGCHQRSPVEGLTADVRRPRRAPRGAAGGGRLVAAVDHRRHRPPTAPIAPADAPPGARCRVGQPPRLSRVDGR